MKRKGTQRLKRPVNAMPAWVRHALTERDLLDSYRARPPYQRNDYLGWIVQAKMDKTQERRLRVMINELARGDRYMGTKYRMEAHA